MGMAFHAILSRVSGQLVSCHRHTMFSWPTVQ